MYNPCHSILVIGGIPHGSWQLRSYELMKLEATEMGYEAPSWLQDNQ
jgi:hypothetical protein